MEFYWNRFLETRILKSTGSGPEKRGTKMESSQTGNGTEENDKTGGCRHGEQVATINHNMPPFALKHNLDLNRSLFLTVTFYLQSFEERERCYVVR